MLIELTRRASIAIDNARRFEHNRDIAETLQRALLTDLPTTPELRLAARYLPATHGLNIGGDWYDAFRQPDGSLITVIGDVTGHGLHAAVMMSQLRTALRAYAVDGGTPGQLLTRLHILLHHLQPDLYATAVIARFHPDDPTLTWAAAGHPPPVLRTPDGQVHTLDAKPGAMLGIPLRQEIGDHTVRLTPGSTLALYTDGLVERRAHGIDPGIERLAASLGAFRSEDLDTDLDGSADRLLQPLLSDSERDDDVCLLLCHLPSRGRRRYGPPSPDCPSDGLQPPVTAPPPPPCPSARGCGRVRARACWKAPSPRCREARSPGVIASNTVARHLDRRSVTSARNRRPSAVTTRRTSRRLWGWTVRCSSPAETSRPHSRLAVGSPISKCSARAVRLSSGRRRTVCRANS